MNEYNKLWCETQQTAIHFVQLAEITKMYSEFWILPSVTQMKRDEEEGKSYYEHNDCEEDQTESVDYTSQQYPFLPYLPFVFQPDALFLLTLTLLPQKLSDIYQYRV